MIRQCSKRIDHLLFIEVLFCIAKFTSENKHFWTQGYLLISKDVEDCVPVFLRHIANEIYVSGKTINLLRVCCPRLVLLPHSCNFNPTAYLCASKKRQLNRTASNKRAGSLAVGVNSVFLVNKAIVDYYFMELNMERHCEALRHFLLMEDGEFAQSLSDLLFEKVPA
ncbi:UNVERIFIED_CONTAM: hypothetical protein FKN15_006461 [Acipenser sinensis]